MKRIGPFIWLFVFVILGCVTVTGPELLVENPSGIDKTKWEKYGAVYEYDELKIVVNSYSAFDFERTYYINRKMHILNREGVKYGTIKLPKYETGLAQFDVRLVDPKGKNVPLDLEKISQKYQETNKIIIPKVEAGCQIYLNIVLRDEEILQRLEHWFERPIPVLKGRISLTAPASYKYAFKAYGDIPPAASKAVEKSEVFIAAAENIMPEDDYFEYRWKYDLEPRVMIELMALTFLTRWEAPTWEEIAKRYRDYFIKKGEVLNVEYAFPKVHGEMPQNIKAPQKVPLKTIINQITASASTDFEKVDAILAHVQNKLTISKKYSGELVNAQAILEKGKGNPYEIVFTLDQILKEAGYDSRVFMTRSRTRGGFDAEIPSYRFMSTPLVAVKINGTTSIAYPFVTGIELGAYPFSYAGLQALDIKTGKIVDLPKSKYDYAQRTSAVTLSLTNWSDPQKWDFSYSAYYGVYIRGRMQKKSPKQRKEYFQKYMKIFGHQNELVSLDIDGLDKRGDIKISAQCRNPSHKTTLEGESHYALGPWFKKHFTAYDPTRTINYTHDVKVIDEESVLVEKTDKKKVKIDFRCKEIDNDLFNVTCEQTKLGRNTRLVRKLTIKPSDLSPEQMKVIYADIKRLNRVDESYIIEK